MSPRPKAVILEAVPDQNPVIEKVDVPTVSKPKQMGPPANPLHSRTEPELNKKREEKGLEWIGVCKCRWGHKTKVAVHSDKNSVYTCYWCDEVTPLMPDFVKNPMLGRPRKVKIQGVVDYDY